MRRNLFLILIMGVLAACSSNKTACTGNCQPGNSINLQKGLDQSRAADQALEASTLKNADANRKNILLAVKELENLRKEMQEMMDKLNVSEADREALKNNVSLEQKDSISYLKNIQYLEKMESVKNRIADIEQLLRGNCDKCGKQ
jgi:hypothetical protein